MRWALLAVVFPQHFILLNKILILGVSVSAVSAPTPGVHSILWCYCEQRFHVVEGISLMMSHLYLNSSWSELLALWVCAVSTYYMPAGVWGPTQLHVPGAHPWTCADCFATSILGHLLYCLAHSLGTGCFFTAVLVPEPASGQTLRSFITGRLWHVLNNGFKHTTTVPRVGERPQDTS